MNLKLEVVEILRQLFSLLWGRQVQAFGLEQNVETADQEHRAEADLPAFDGALIAVGEVDEEDRAEMLFFVQQIGDRLPRPVTST